MSQIPSQRYRRRPRSRSSKMKKILKKIGKRLSFRIIAISLLIIFTVTSITLAALIADSVSELRNAWQSFNRVLDTISASDGTTLTLDDFNRLETSAEELSSRLLTTSQRIRAVNPILSLNADWSISADVIDVSLELANATNSMLDGLQPALNFMVQGETDEAVTARISSGERLVELIDLGYGQFLSASENLEEAELRLADIVLNTVSSELLLQVESLSDYQQQLTAINQILINSPDLLNTLLGLDTERSYLVLAQNNDELRPSGGYVSTYGWFTVRSGRIINYNYSPTTTTSPRSPDADFLEEQGIVIPDWWIRYNQPVYAAWDGSWFADFPSTADMAMSYYNAGDNPQASVDGVLAIDITGFELMLDALGEVSVEGYDTVVTTENFRELVYNIRAFGQGETPHKQFVASIYRSIFQEWSEIDQERTPELLGALIEGFRQKHIMFYFEDNELNLAIDTLGWSGRQQPAYNHDYLLIADANLGNKSNSSVDQSITYDVEILPDGVLNSRLAITVEYFDDIASLDPAIDPQYHGPLDYRSLLQVFLPVGVSVSDVENIGNYRLLGQVNHSLFVNSSVVEYDSGERYLLHYTTPSLIQTIGDLQTYRLLVQKQPGSRSQVLSVQVRLPEDAQLVFTSPEADASYNLEQPIIDFRLELNTDMWIEVAYKLP